MRCVSGAQWLKAWDFEGTESLTTGAALWGQGSGAVQAVFVLPPFLVIAWRYGENMAFTIAFN